MDKETASRLAVLTALRDAIEEEVEALRDDVRAGLKEAHDLYGVKSVDVSLPDGSVIASITLSKATPRPYVHDERAVVQYVAENYPDEVERQVRPAFKKVLFDALTPLDDRAVNTMTGEVVPGVTFRTSQQSISLRFKEDGRAAVASAWRAGAVRDLLGPATQPELP